MIPQLKHVAAVSLAFFAPVQQLLVLTGVLITVDLVTGIAASLKRKHRITSSRLGRSVAKSAVYGIAICTCFVIESVFVTGVPMVKMISALIGLTEATSIFENLNIASGQNLLSLLLSQMKSIQDKDKD